MIKLKAWVGAARLRTLPLSISGILVGTALANHMGFKDNVIFILCLLTTVAFQVTSNFANDYGDGTKGTDGEDRIGPARALQSGALAKSELKKGIILSIGVSFLLALALIYRAFGTDSLIYIGVFLVLAIASIWAALKYTMGRSPYGYKGMGDVFVFLFFGLLAVLGTLFLYAKSVSMDSFLPATAIGLLCVGVLNLNNMRDFESDKKHGKNTLIVKMGFEAGKRYHYFLILGSFVLMLWFTLVNFSKPLVMIYLVAYIPIFVHLRKVMVAQEPALLDPELKKLALSTFLLALLLYIAINYFL